MSNNLDFLQNVFQTLMAATRDYAQAANLLQGVTNVIEHLETYSDSVDEIKSLSQRMKQIRTDLAGHVTSDFNEAFSSSCKYQFKITEASRCIMRVL